MGEAVEQGRGHLGVAEHGGPFTEAEVGGDDDAGAFVKFAEQVEQERPARGAERQVSKLVQDDEVKLGQAFGNLPGFALGLFLFEGIDQFDGREEANLAAMMLDGLDTEGRRDMGFARSLRRGEALLAGLLRCGHCGRKLHVAYSGKGGNTGRYHCRGSQFNHGGARCISFGGMRVDRAISTEIIARLQPLGIEAALQADAAREEAHAEKRHQLELNLEQARYEASRARRQYDAVDPDNRLVAGELEARWNARLGDVSRLEDQMKAYDETAASHHAGAADRAQLMSLGADIERAWGCPGTTPATKKQIIRTLVEEIVVSVDGETIELIIHWQGGAHSALAVRKNRCGQHRWTTDSGVVELTRALARLMPDKLIASALNRAGKVTGRGNGWTQSRVCTLRNYHQIDVYREGERQERGELPLDEAAEALAISASSVRRLIKEGRLPAEQFCKGAPWIIKMEELGKQDVILAAEQRRSCRPPSDNTDQKTLPL